MKGEKGEYDELNLIKNSYYYTISKLNEKPLIVSVYLCVPKESILFGVLLQNIENNDNNKQFYWSISMFERSKEFHIK